MEYNYLGKSGMQVSKICCGTHDWHDDEGSQVIAEQCFERGINFFDTAEMYSIPPMAETQGSTEKIIGSWFKKNSNRDKVILASK